MRIEFPPAWRLAGPLVCDIERDVEVDFDADVAVNVDANVDVNVGMGMDVDGDGDRSLGCAVEGDRDRDRHGCASSDGSASRSNELSQDSRCGVGSNEPSREPFEDQLARLAASVGPVRRVLAAIAARMLDVRGWERLGYVRLGDYARERPGVSARQLQDLACVHRRLGELPLLECALVENTLPWSKVRLVARVADAGSEAAWIARAGAVSTRALERAVRAAVAGVSGGGFGNEEKKQEQEDEEADRLRVRLTIRCTPEVERRWQRTREIAERVAGRRLTGAETLELVVAEGSSGLPVDASLGDFAEACIAPVVRDAEPPAGSEASPPRRAAARPLPGLVRLVAGLDTADAFVLDGRLLRAVRLEQTLDAAVTPLLQCVTAREFEWRDAYQTLAQVAEEWLGMSASKARALRRLGNAAGFVPALARAYRTGALSWVKAQCLLPLLLMDVGGEADWRPAWVAWAQRVSFRRLADDVRRARAMRTVSDRAFHRCLYHPATVSGPLTEAELRQQQMCAHAGCGAGSGAAEPEQQEPEQQEASERLAFRVDPDVAQLYAGLHEAYRTLLQRETRWWPTDSEVLGACSTTR